ncbi:MAG: hypothetical protein U0990_07930 [Candidatus Nanopelagicales bacterium]|nr:hypothetical protein [Candidatus Nanopelagicales bacterium]MDZ4250003.1 hypothetical protein [Candidatus Nanopelagicales bacterium]MDZ7578962.1 hypothetical protein [Candidatus Nanopelagicales bacterium]
MKTRTRTAAIGIFGAAAITTALLAGCSGTTSGTPSATDTGLTAEQTQYCTAVTTWGTSAASVNVKAAIESGDPEQIKAAYQVYLAETQAMVDSVPADAPDNVKQAYQAISTAIKNTAAGTVTKKQAAAQTAARPVVVAYYAEVCN